MVRMGLTKLSGQNIVYRCKNLIKSPAFYAVQDNLALILLCLSGVACFFVNSVIDNAVVFHDEYVYKLWATRDISDGTIISNGLAQFIPNSLYEWIYGFASYAGANFYLVAQFFNVVFWILGVALLYDFSKLFDLGRMQRVCYLLLMLLLPLATYTKYFMPEAMYFFVFCLSVTLLFRGLFFESLPLIFVAGVVVGLLYFVKPHAIIIMIVTLMVFARAYSGKELRSKSTIYTIGFLLVYMIGRFIVNKHEMSSSLGVYDQMLRGLISSFNSLSSNPKKLLEAIANLFAVHIASFALFFSAAYFVLRSYYAGVSSGSRLCIATPLVRAAQFGTWLVWITVSLTVVSVMFSVLAGESVRIHTRYYSFLYPLWLIFIVLPLADTAKYKRWVYVVTIIAFCVIYSYFFLVVPLYSSVLHISVVSDSPELGFIFASKAVFLTVFSFLVSGSIALVITGRKSLLIIGLCMAFITSNVYVRTMQKSVFRGPFTDGIDAVSAERQLGKDVFSRSLVIGENRVQMSKFLFGVNSAPVVVEHTPGDVSGLLKKYNRFDSVLVLSPGYILPTEYKCNLLVGTVFLCLR